MKLKLLSTLIAASFLAGCSSSGSSNGSGGQDGEAPMNPIEMTPSNPIEVSPEHPDNPEFVEPSVPVAKDIIVVDEELKVDGEVVAYIDGNDRLVNADGHAVGHVERNKNGQVNNIYVSTDTYGSVQVELNPAVNPQDRMVTITGENGNKLEIFRGDGSWTFIPSGTPDLPIYDDVENPIGKDITVVDGELIVDGVTIASINDDDRIVDANGNGFGHVERNKNGQVNTIHISTNIYGFVKIELNPAVNPEDRMVTITGENGNKLEIFRGDGSWTFIPAGTPDLPIYDDLENPIGKDIAVIDGELIVNGVTIASINENDHVIDANGNGLGHVERNRNGQVNKIYVSSEAYGVVQIELNPAVNPQDRMVTITGENGNKLEIFRGDGSWTFVPAPDANLPELDNSSATQKAKLKQKIQSLSQEQRQQIKQAVKDRASRS
ncbi:hypothetical protein A143_16515 [Vibrio splendidus ZS-139]|nr:hypothetical protein A143_16515 [Vibrio splendidus ZS-139]